MIIPYPNFKPRHYQSEILRAFFVEQKKRFYYLCHRRAGKDMTCWNILWGAACQRVGTYLYLLPLHTQARKIIWRGMIGSGQSFLSMVPKQLIASINNTEMSIRLINGSIIQLGGSNNYNSLMGTNPVGIVLSEFALHTPLAINYLTPILVENDGFLICQTTPRGKNHAYHLYNAALADNNWFVRKFTIDDTFKNDGSPVITHAQIDAERRAGVAEEILRQEWWLDFNVGVQGAYYTTEMDKMEYEGRVCHFEVDKNLPVFTSWDLGVRDSTVIILFQYIGNMINIIYHIEKTNEGIEYFVRRLGEVKEQLGFKRYQNHFAPHDIRNREWGSSAKSRLSIAHDLGIHFLVVPNVSIVDGIQAVRSIFPQLRIHAGNCKQFLDAVKEYRREYDEVNRVFSSTPLHNWASNSADALRYLAVGWRANFAQPEMNEVRKYRMDGPNIGIAHTSVTHANQGFMPNFRQ